MNPQTNELRNLENLTEEEIKNLLMRDFMEVPTKFQVEAEKIIRW